MTANVLHPCGDCGAAANEPCAEDCINITDAPDWPDEVEQPKTDQWESQTRIMAAVYRLPFGRLAGEAPDHQLMDLQSWLDQLGTYLTSYMDVAHEQVDHLSSRATKAITLEMQQDMVRSFLGLSSATELVKA